MSHVEVRQGAYADSVTLLQVSRSVQQTDGVTRAQVAMATELNLEVLEQMGFDIPGCSPNDMVVAIEAESDQAVQAALAAVESALVSARKGGGESTEREAHRTTGAALREGPGLALVSVPGASAAVEAMDALESGSDVMIFSDNVPVEQEVALKAFAEARDLLVMGPDCGTAVVGGVGLGFANATSPGPVGMVAASGTGCQQVLALLDHAGVGVTTAYGVGGRDLSAGVGGVSTLRALQRLTADPSVEQVVVVSKPPAEEVASRLRARAEELGGVTLALLGPGQPDLTRATEDLLSTMGRQVPEWPVTPPETEPSSRPGLLRGLFVGGTLCDEAMLIAGESLGDVRSNIPLRADLAIGDDLDGAMTGESHVMVDFGDDALTQGRAHPMIDPTLRLEQLARLAEDDRTGVVLLDVVLGHGAEADPAAGLVPVLERLQVPVVVACVGTVNDPQDLSSTTQRLSAAGAEVHLSNAGAVRRAVDLITKGADR